MVQLVDQHLDFNYVAQAQKLLIESIAAVDAAAAVEGSLTYVAGTDHHFHGYDGTVDQTVPWTTDLGIQITDVTADPGTVPAEPYIQYNRTNNEFKYSDGTVLRQIWTEEQGKIVQQLAADPASAAANEGDVFYNTTDNAMKFDDGTQIKTLVTTDQIGSLFRTRSTAFNAGAGALPVAGDATVFVGEALAQGDVFFVTTGGTIAGIQGDDVLEPGDFLVLADAGAPTVGASWFGIQANLNLPTTLPAYEEQTVNLAAGADLTITAGTLTQIRDVSIYDNNAKKRPFIDLTIATATTVTANSLNAITGARAWMLGSV